jgi:hypothetical protein
MDPQPPEGGERKSNKKLWLVIGAFLLALMALSVAVTASRVYRSQAESTFKMAMDEFFGRGNYHYEKLEIKFLRKTLTASTLTFQPTGLARDLGLTAIGSLTLARPAKLEALRDVLDGKAKPGTVLAEELIVDSPDAKFLDALYGFLDNDCLLETSVGSIKVTGLKMGEDQGYLADLLPKKWQRLSFGTLALTGISVTATDSRELNHTFKVAGLTVASPEPQAGSAGFFGLLAGFGPIPSLTVDGLDLRANLYGGEAELDVILDKFQITDLSIVSLKSLLISKLHVDFRFEDMSFFLPLELTVDNFAVNDVDLTKTGLGKPSRGGPILAEIFGSAASLGLFEVTGLEMHLADSFAIGVKRFGLSAKLGGGQEPSSIDSQLDSLTVSLAARPAMPGIGEFRAYVTEKLGRDSFTYSSNVKTTYDPGDGTLTVTGSPKARLDDYFEVSSSLTLTGLTTGALAQLALGELSPENLFAKSRGIKLTGFEVTVKNENYGALVSALAEYPAIKGMLGDQTLQGFKAGELYPAIDEIAQNASSSPKVTAQLAEALRSSIESPGTLTFKAAPPSPVDVSEFGKATPETYARLNLTVTRNDGPPIALGNGGATKTAQAAPKAQTAAEGPKPAPAAPKAAPTPSPTRANAQAAARTGAEAQAAAKPAPPVNEAAVTPEEYWLKFSFLMDSLFGEGNWEAGQDRNYNASSRIYKVSPFSADLKAYLPEQKGQLTAASVEISSPLTTEEIKAINAKVLKAGQSELIFDKVNFILLRLELPRAVANAEKFDVNLSSLSLGEIHMAKYTDPPDDGPFLSRLRINQAGLENLSVASMIPMGKSQRLALNLEVPAGSFKEMALGRLVGAISASLELWPNVEMGDAQLEGLRLSLSTNQDTYVSLTTGRIGVSRLLDLTMEIFEANDLSLATRTISAGKKSDMVSNLKNVNFFALDLRPLYDKGLGSAEPNLLSSVTPSFSLSWAGLEGFDFDNQDIRIALESAKIEGPFTHMKIPQLAVAQINGLNVDLSRTANPGLSTFAKLLEADKFNLSSEVKFVYSPETGLATLTAEPALSDPGLFDLSFGLTLAGLSPSLVTELSKISYDSRERALFMPGAEKLVLTEAHVNLGNKALAKNFYSNVTSGADRTPAELEANLQRRVNALIDAYLGQNLESKRLLASDLINFIHRPDSLDVTAKPSPELPVNRLLAGTLSPADLNSMAINLTSNGQSPVVLRWGAQ